MRSGTAWGRIGLFALAGLVAGCSGDSTSPGAPAGTEPLSFNLATRPRQAAGLSLSVTQTLGGHTLVLDTVQLVMRRLKLKPSEAACAGEGEGGHEGSCAELKVGPLLVELPLNEGAQPTFTVDVPAGTYRRIEFNLHRPVPGEPGDDALLAANPVLQAHPTSVRVVGSFDGTPFEYYTDAVVEADLPLAQDLVVADGTPAELTLLADVNSWFLDESGTGLVDPATAIGTGENKGLVWRNIVASFRSFEDGDHDGHDDHDEPGGDLPDGDHPDGEVE